MDEATVTHWSLIDDEPAGICWQEDHYPQEAQKVTSKIEEVTCVKCLHWYINEISQKR